MSQIKELKTQPSEAEQEELEKAIIDYMASRPEVKTFDPQEHPYLDKLCRQRQP